MRSFPFGVPLTGILVPSINVTSGSTFQDGVFVEGFLPKYEIEIFVTRK